MSLQPLPPSFKPLRDLVAHHERVLEARKKASVDLRRLDAELQRAAAVDRETFADRLSKDVDAKDPGGKEQEKVRAKIVETKARYDALAVSVEKAEAAITGEIEANGAKWLAAENAAAEKSRQKYAEVVEALVAAREEYGAKLSLTRWLREPKLGFKETLPPVHAKTLLRPNGSQMPFAMLAEALREDAKPPHEQGSLLPNRIWPPRQTEPEPELDRVA
jgi:hypothetical protein